MRSYAYVGPDHIRVAAEGASSGTPIDSRDALVRWIASNGADIATFVVTPDGVLRVANRRSEHVACAAGQPVLSAGEIQFAHDRVALWADRDGDRRGTGAELVPVSSVLSQISLAAHTTHRCDDRANCERLRATATTRNGETAAIVDIQLATQPAR